MHAEASRRSPLSQLTMDGGQGRKHHDMLSELADVTCSVGGMFDLASTNAIVSPSCPFEWSSCFPGRGLDPAAGAAGRQMSSSRLVQLVQCDLTLVPCHQSCGAITCAAVLFHTAERSHRASPMPFTPRLAYQSRAAPKFYRAMPGTTCL